MAILLWWESRGRREGRKREGEKEKGRKEEKRKRKTGRKEGGKIKVSVMNAKQKTPQRQV